MFATPAAGPRPRTRPQRSVTMLTPSKRLAPAVRRGAAVVELAVLLPLLAFVFFVTVDYSRIFYCTVTVSNAACGGALYACRDAAHAADVEGIRAAALADAVSLRPAPEVT